MKFENTEVMNFEGAIRGMRNNFIYTLRGIDISKFGWAKRLSDYLGIPKNQIVNTVRRFDELYRSIV